MTRSSIIVALLLSLTVAPLAASAQEGPEGPEEPAAPAQPPEPAGPEVQAAPAVPAAPGPVNPQQAMPPGHPPVGPVTAQAQIAADAERSEQDQREGRTQPGVPSEQMRQALSGETPEIASAAPSTEVPIGSIRVMVVDVSGNPMAGVEVDLGVMSQENSRDRMRQTTDESGTTVYSGLPTGQGQAYRVNVHSDGARYSANPFQLPTDRGYQVSIVNLPTTRSAEAVLLMLHRTFLELRAERLHVVHQLQLVNLSRETYVFPTDGHEVLLPEDYTAFQFQEVMSDQHVTENDDSFTVKGSLPPGRTNLVYGYDLPLDGTEIDFSIPVAFRTFSVRVEALAAPNMRLDVEGMPEAQPHESDGQRILITEMQREPTDPALEELVIHVGGIEGPGPQRWVAVGAALVLLVMGLLFAYRGGSADPVHATRARDLQKKDLLDQAAELERMFEDNEVGPKYRRREMDAITTRLASILREEQAAQARES